VFTAFPLTFTGIASKVLISFGSLPQENKMAAEKTIRAVILLFIRLIYILIDYFLIFKF
jgi:hypothetical protein